MEHGRLAEARSVLEFGSGTGRFAVRLLSDVLPEQCRYLGLDVSPVMVRTAGERLGPWKGRAEVRLSNGCVKLDLPAENYERFVCTYVMDLLSEESIRTLLDEAHRVLMPGGLLCLATLTFGKGLFSRWVTATWRAIHALSPAFVGGCRPIEMGQFLSAGKWHVESIAVLSSFGISSEAIVASRPLAAPPGKGS